MTENERKRQILTIPNLLSLFRLCLIPVCAWAYCVRQDSILTMLLLLLSGITDVVDGFIARKFHMVSDLGKALDPIADKLTQFVMLLCMVAKHRLMLLPLGFMVVKEVFAGASGLMVIHKTGNVLGAQWHGKATTVLLYGMMLVLLCTAMMFLSFVLYALRNIREIRGGAKE